MTPSIIDRFNLWRQNHLTDTSYFFLLTLIIGLFAGTAAHLLKLMIGSVTTLVHHGFHDHGVNWWFLIVPTVGILLTGLFQRYVVKVNLEHGVEHLKSNLNDRKYTMTRRSLVSRMIASSLTLGFGGSAGSEGPIAMTGASIGSNVGQALKLPDNMMRILVGCGAAAGIAGIFKSSVGGAMFAFEALALELSVIAVIGVFVTCITASLTAYILSGCTIDLAFTNHPALPAEIYPYVIILGIFTGFYSIYYTFIMRTMRKWFDSISSPWKRNLISGSILSILVFSFPALYGEGYGIMGKIVNGEFEGMLNGSLLSVVDLGAWSLIAVTAAIILVKAFACSSSNCGGGVAGDYAPTLFAGVVTGFFFALLLNKVAGLDLPVGLFGLFGMAGVMSGSIGTPLLAIFITTEMASAYDYFLPICIVGFSSIIIVRLFSKQPFLHRSRAAASSNQ
ncbi:MAG: chloride channel protein [Bacteroidales bacterium]|nr:chloride channel protein [Bacteroidales bacterium]